MHIYFSGIGGAGISPLALVATQAGHTVSGSDKQTSSYIEYLRSQGLDNIHIGQTTEDIAQVHESQPIDWFVYSSALPMENPNHPELRFCQEKGIKATKRDEFLNHILTEKQLKLIAIAGTHGKTTTTAMTVWLLQQLGVPISYILPAKTTFATMGSYDPQSEYFVYECDEFDRNFLSFSPELSMITGIDWDHPDIYPTKESYDEAFRDFLKKSDKAVMWQTDFKHLSLQSSEQVSVLDEEDLNISKYITLPGLVNRQNAWQVANSLNILGGYDIAASIAILNRFPGVSRRFELITEGLYTDYAHTPPKIQGALQLGHEVAGDDLVVVYEGLHNTRQHFIKEDLKNLFAGVKSLYVVPSYLAREDQSLELLTPEKLIGLMDVSIQSHAAAAKLDEQLKQTIQMHLDQGDTVLCLTAGGGGSLDEWLRKAFI